MTRKAHASRMRPSKEKRPTSYLPKKKTRTETERWLDEIQRLAHIGGWSWDTKTNQILWSDETYSIHGRDRRLPPPTFKELPSLMTPESRERLMKYHEEILATGTSREIELEVVGSDGQKRWIVSNTAVECDSSGKVVRLYGTSQDITERKRAETLLEQALIETDVRFKVSQALARAETEEQVLDALIQQANLDTNVHVSIVTFEHNGDEVIGVLRRIDAFKAGFVRSRHPERAFRHRNSR